LAGGSRAYNLSVFAADQDSLTTDPRDPARGVAFFSNAQTVIDQPVAVVVQPIADLLVYLRVAPSRGRGAHGDLCLLCALYGTSTAFTEGVA